jgi:hypothetical protein
MNDSVKDAAQALLDKVKADRLNYRRDDSTWKNCPYYNDKEWEVFLDYLDYCKEWNNN